MKWGVPYTQGNHLSISFVSVALSVPGVSFLSVRAVGAEQWAAAAELPLQNSPWPGPSSFVSLTNIQDGFSAPQKDAKY